MNAYNIVTPASAVQVQSDINLPGFTITIAVPSSPPIDILQFQTDVNTMLLPDLNKMLLDADIPAATGELRFSVRISGAGSPVGMSLLVFWSAPHARFAKPAEWLPAVAENARKLAYDATSIAYATGVERYDVSRQTAEIRAGLDSTLAKLRAQKNPLGGVG